MNKLEIENLSEIIQCKYKHICLEWSDLSIFLNIPIQNKNFYRFYRGGEKTGAFNNGQTIVWTYWSGLLSDQSGHIKIATSTPKDNQHGWSELLSFKEKDSPMKIYKLMKMKVFW